MANSEKFNFGNEQGPEMPTLKPKSSVTLKRSLTLYEPPILYLQGENLILTIGFFRVSQTDREDDSPINQQVSRGYLQV